ncbi:MAG: hypothetical protein L0H83_09490 [Salinisphaera sp.]|nr:hypothetical protein [Salinisphaera sp.]
MLPQPRWFLPAAFPIGAGVLWMAVGWRSGIVVGLYASLPGILLLGPGTALLLWPGDRQISHYLALGGLCSSLLALPMLLWTGVPSGALLVLVGLISFVLAGYAALYQAAPPPDAPTPRFNLSMARKVAIDEAMLAYFVGSARLPIGSRVETDARELRELQALAEARDWLAHPARLHPAPPAPAAPQVRAHRAAGESFLHLRFDSDYEPDPALPGGARWAAYQANQKVHAWILRHPGAPRAWVMGVHGYRMGMPWVDFSLFQVEHLHRRLGLNLILPVLPLHGPRRAFARSGTGFLDGQLADIFHAEAQSLWDLRRSLAWLQSIEDAPRVAVLGYSLGGYNAALLAALEPDLACVIAGIPLADIADAVWRHLPLVHRRYVESSGVTPELARAALAPVSPLALPCQVERSRRYLFGATGDQLVPPGQVARLAAHWETEQILWYQGSHLSVRQESTVREYLTSALEQSGLVGHGNAAHACAPAVETGE